MDDIKFLDESRELITITEVVCGMAKGADEAGRQWALWNHIPVKEFPADWKKNGRGAGFVRNREMAEYADALIIFPGGRGSMHMAQTAFEMNLEIYENIN